MKDLLNKGVHMHSFSDSSGCVFLNTYSGESLSVGVSQSDLITLVSLGQDYDKANTTLDAITTLVNKGFLKSLDTQGFNA